jgi:hypothetical protein
MSAQIENISLYIPHVFPNYTKEDVKNVFENQKIGKVSHVDFVSKMGQDGKPYNAAYIHFEFWCDTIANRNFQSRICDPTKEARVVYDEPWYWIVLENKARKYAAGERKPRIDLSDLKPAAAAKPSTVLKPVQVLKQVATQWPALPVAAPKPKPEPELAEDDADYLELIEDFATSEYDPEDTEFKQLINEMDECVVAMEEEDQHLITVDARYLKTLEEENAYFRNELQLANIRNMELNNSLYNEQIKSNALAEAIRLVSNKN